MPTSTREQGAKLERVDDGIDPYKMQFRKIKGEKR